MSTTSIVLKNTIQKRLGVLRSAVDSIGLGETGATLEIGSGHGHFLAAYAAENSSELCVGLDLLAGRVERSQRKKRAAGLDNLHFVRGEAWELLTVWPEHVPIHKVWILFPDPWPKKRHAARRLVSDGFLYLLDMRTSVDARIYFRTDHIPYLDAVRECIAKHSRWQLADEQFPFECQTVFEARAPSYGSVVAKKR